MSCYQEQRARADSAQIEGLHYLDLSIYWWDYFSTISCSGSDLVSKTTSAWKWQSQSTVTQSLHYWECGLRFEECSIHLWAYSVRAVWLSFVWSHLVSFSGSRALRFSYFPFLPLFDHTAGQTSTKLGIFIKAQVKTSWEDFSWCWVAVNFSTENCNTATTQLHFILFALDHSLSAVFSVIFSNSCCPLWPREACC